MHEAKKHAGHLVAVAVAAALCGALFSFQAAAASKKDSEERVKSAVEVFGEILNIPETSIPPSLLNNCAGLVVIPRMVKGAFIVGGQRGKGIMVHRLPKGAWSNPCFVTITGASVGLQIGGQGTDVILVVNNERGFQALLSDSFKFGAGASVAAGPVGRDMTAGTDAKLKAEIYSYSRSKGVFAGVSLEGCALTIDTEANVAYYSKSIAAKTLVSTASKPYPASAVPLLNLLKPYTKIKK